MSLRKSIIRLAFSRPEFRDVLLPLLSKEAGRDWAKDARAAAIAEQKHRNKMIQGKPSDKYLKKLWDLRDKADKVINDAFDESPEAGQAAMKAAKEGAESVS